MKRDELRTGMVVTFRNGRKYMVMLNTVEKDDFFVSLVNDRRIPLTAITKNTLRCDYNKNYDIMKVEAPNNIRYAFDFDNICKWRTIYKRKETVVKYKYLIIDNQCKTVELTKAYYANETAVLAGTIGMDITLKRVDESRKEFPC